MVGNANSGRKNDPARRTDAATSGIPIAPPQLSEAARAKFDELAPLLVDEFGAGALDSDLLALYCESWADYWASTKMADKKSHRDFVYKMGRELGLSPKSRLRLPKNLNVGGAQGDEFDEEDAG